MVPDAENIADIVGRNAAATPEAIAIIEPGRRIDYRRFDQAIWRAAAWFRKRGVAPGDVVGLAMDSNALHLVAIHALALIGAVHLPLNRSDPVDTNRALVKRFRATVAFTDADVDPTWLEGGDAADASLRVPGGDRPLRIVFSSGTTGVPKAVLQTHAMNIAWRRITQAGIPLAADDRYILVVKMTFNAGLLRCMNMLQVGGSIIIPASLKQPGDLLAEVDRHQATYLYLPATWLQPLVPLAPERGLRLPSVRILRTGSMVASLQLRNDTLARLTPNLLVSYGTNEIGTPTTVAPKEMLARHPETLGAAAPGVELGITDDDGRPLPAGETGHVRMRSAGMPAGYMDDPAASARAFRGGWFYPGDIGEMNAEGLLFYKGRSDERMNYTGIKIYPSEIEAALLAHPSVAEAAAFPIASELHQELPGAAVVLRPGATQADWRKWCRERLGAHAPVIVIQVDKFPRSERGKILKRQLAESARRAIDQAAKAR